MRQVDNVNYMSFGESPIPSLRICMGMFAACALLVGVTMSFEGHASLALTNLCGASFFIFAYHNPDALVVQQHTDAATSEQDSIENVEQKKFLWASLVIGSLAVLIEFQEYLPLG